MVFASPVFLFLFLPLSLALYFLPLKSRTYKNAVLLFASLFFYAWGEPVFVAVMLVSILWNYRCALGIAGEVGSGRKRWLSAAVVFDLTLMFLFKYLVFTFENLGLLFGGTGEVGFRIELPIGISFFTFQIMSYVFDVYYKKTAVQQNILHLALYISMFPQLIAGPIVRYQTVAQEIAERKETREGFARGTERFIIGLAKKVLIANYMAQVADSIFAQSGMELSVATAWLGAICYTLQIYYDFSGYSDMAIGLGRMLGFDFPENFDYPFISATISEFWRRWHMTLGGWFRDYLYIPLGGNRVSRGRWIFNTAIVWAATGLWHGAAWNFLWWGVYFGVLLVCEKLVWGGLLKKLNGFWRRVYVLPLLLISFAIFNAANMQQLTGDLKNMIGLGGLDLWSFETGYYLRSYAVLLLSAVVGATPLPKKLWQRFAATRAGQAVSVVAEPLFILAMLLIGTAYLVDGSFNPFLYFRF